MSSERNNQGYSSTLEVDLLLSRVALSCCFLHGSGAIYSVEALSSHYSSPNTPSDLTQVLRSDRSTSFLRQKQRREYVPRNWNISLVTLELTRRKYPEREGLIVPEGIDHRTFWLAVGCPGGRKRAGAPWERGLPDVNGDARDARSTTSDKLLLLCGV